MVTLDSLLVFFGWCSVFNIAILLLSTGLLAIFKDSVASIHGKMFGIDPDTLSLTYFQYLGSYKIAIFIFNLVPYLTLRIMS